MSRAMARRESRRPNGKRKEASEEIGRVETKVCKALSSVSGGSGGMVAGHDRSALVSEEVGAAEKVA